jgi:Sec-independent protein translocase protein TatA
VSADPRVSTEAAVARLSAQMEAIGREIGQMRRDTSDRLDRIETQTRLTNGRVSRNDQRIRELEHIEEDRADDHRQSERHRDRVFVRATWVIGTLLTLLIAGVGWILTILGA